ncbi:hypothetical protein VTK73DRAFT_1331 [Phialemonium thermophilum]|uniref:Uncharacterized protein n=1 Tax=Phialemonium thermophilum TaxID=223376 RepID=A0ABR3X9Z0_9PEZI
MEMPGMGGGVEGASGDTISRAEIDAMIRAAQVPNTPKVSLQNICSVNGLPRTGVKADLQRRITNLIRECVQRNDTLRLREIQNSLYNHTGLVGNAGLQQGHRYSHTGLPGQQGYLAQGSPSSISQPMMPGWFQNGSAVDSPRGTGSQQGLTFKPSPFYEIQRQIGDVRVCETMVQHRHSITIPLRLVDHPLLANCLTDKSMRVMVFCAAANTGVQDISFPHQSELKVNGGEVKANLRGLKNKPGSTRPVDITDLLRFKPSVYENTIEFTYALTTKKYYLGIYLCKSSPMEKLVDLIAKGKKITKPMVIREIAKKAEDVDVIATSFVLSLSCPITRMRLKDPCRGLKCAHIQCFDATSYLMLQEQGPQWICPICNNPAPFEQLAMDEYVKDILLNTSSSTEQVTIEPNGQWSAKKAEKAQSNPEPREASLVEDNDVVETSAISKNPMSTPTRPASSLTTHHDGSGDIYSAQRLGSTSSKRPAREVIDLTLSDDEELVHRPAKRQNTSTNGWSH